MSAPGTIGWHLAMAARENATLAFLDEAMATTASQRDAEAYYLAGARHEGAAAGHAFRAAELAYDLGQEHARVFRIRALKRLLDRIDGR